MRPTGLSPACQRSSELGADGAPAMTRYRLLPPDRAADGLEKEVLALWSEEDLFGRLQRERAGHPEFVFFEGPPTANGRPGIHHVFARTVKDLFCRHRAMKGFHVTRKAGWDTHGLPVEIEVEKQLGISGKQDIERIGVEKFNALCRESVFKYRADWEKLSERIGYWLDYDRSVRHVLEQLRRERVVGAQDAAREGASLSRPQDPSVLPALRHCAVVTRSRAGLQDREGSERLRRARRSQEATALAGSSSGPRRRGRWYRTPRSR